MFETIINQFASWGYFGIITLMAIESSFIPFPSEVVIPPAGYLASQGRMNIYLVILSGIIGSLIGAIFNYYFAKHLGSRVIHRLARSKWAKWFLISPESLEKAEQYFRDNGNISTFAGRLMPGIRQLISIPAGLAKMDMKPFLFYTTLGSGLWCAILAILGYFVGENQELLKEYYKELSLGGIIIFVALVSHLIYKNNGGKHAKKSQE